MKNQFYFAGTVRTIHVFARMARFGLRVGIAIIVATFLCHSSEAQFGNGNFSSRVVGGVRIDAAGIVQDAVAVDQNADMEALRNLIAGGKNDFAKSASIRRISLKQLQAAMQEAADQNKPLPEEMLLLGGLTRIEYVMAYPESQDIVIAGPSENWTIGKNGAIIGIESGRPIVYLADLITAFQTSDSSRTNPISCSIDPTPEGTRQLTALLDGVRLGPGSNPVSFEPAMRKAFGPQKVSLTGLPSNSHMARVIFAADYQMKRYGMNIAQAPVKGLPSYIEMIRNKSVKSPQSRWWMACDYKAIEHSEDKLTWRISGRGIKTMTEQEAIQKDGTIHPTGKTEPIAQKWAELFTDKLDELSIQDPIFGDLRNVMDACVIAALVQNRNLDKIASCDLALLRGEKKSVQLSDLTAPTQLDPQCSFLKTAGGWVVTASGGVMVDAWSTVSKTTENDQLSTIRDQAKSSKNSWSWTE